METRDPIDFCPAAALAAEVARLERLTDIAARLIGHAAPSAECVPLMRGLEAMVEDLVQAAEEARGRMAEVVAVSAAGAMAQLLAALRDVRIGDDAERLRARALEAKAVRFLTAAGLYEDGACALLSGAKAGAYAQASSALQIASVSASAQGPAL